MLVRETGSLYCPVCAAPGAQKFLCVDARDYWRCEVPAKDVALMQKREYADALA